MEVKFGLDFDPADDFDGADLEGSYTIFGSFSEAFPLVETQTGIDYGQESIFQDSQNFDFGFWSELAEGADVDFDPNAVGVYNLGVYVYSLEGALLASSEISVETVDSCNDPLASNYNMGDGACTYCDSTNNAEQLSRGGIHDWFWFVERPHERGHRFMQRHHRVVVCWSVTLATWSLKRAT